MQRSAWRRSATATGIAAFVAAGLLSTAPSPRQSSAEDIVEATAEKETSQVAADGVAQTAEGAASGGLGVAPGEGPRRPAEPSQQWQVPEGPKPAWMELGEQRATEYTLDYIAFRKKLREKISVSYEGQPFRSVMKDLSKRLNIPVVLDEIAMAAGISGPDDPVTVEPIEVSVGKALDLILEPLELRYEWDDGTLVITTFDENPYRDTRYYDLSYVLPNDAATAELVELIQRYVNGDWDTGEDDLTIFGSILVVRAPEKGHQAIEALLARIAQMPREHFDCEWTKPREHSGGSFCGESEGTQPKAPAASGDAYGAAY